jgi:hypothetical protein
MQAALVREGGGISIRTLAGEVFDTVRSEHAVHTQTKVKGSKITSVIAFCLGITRHVTMLSAVSRRSSLSA